MSHPPSPSLRMRVDFCLNVPVIRTCVVHARCQPSDRLRIRMLRLSRPLCVTTGRAWLTRYVSTAEGGTHFGVTPTRAATPDVSSSTTRRLTRSLPRRTILAPDRFPRAHRREASEAQQPSHPHDPRRESRPTA